MLLLHLFVNSGSVECALKTISCVYSEIMFTIISLFQKSIKGEVGIRAGRGLENFSKTNKWGGGG